MIKEEDLPHLHQAPLRHPKWLKIKKKNDPQPQENVPTPSPQVQEQEEKNIPPQAQVTHDPHQKTSTHEPLVKHGRISKDHPMD